MGALKYEEVIIILLQNFSEWAFYSRSSTKTEFVIRIELEMNVGSSFGGQTKSGVQVRSTSAATTYIEEMSENYANQATKSSPS